MWDDAWPIALAAMFGLLGKWLLDGGIKRKNLTAIREELDVAVLMERQSETAAADLRDRAEARLAVYLRPTRWRDWNTWAKIIGIGCAAGGVIAIVLLFTVWRNAGDDTQSTVQLAGMAIAFVGMITSGQQYLRKQRAMRLEEELQLQREDRLRYFQEHREELRETVERVQRSWMPPDPNAE